MMKRKEKKIQISINGDMVDGFHTVNINKAVKYYYFCESIPEKMQNATKFS